MFLPLLLSLLGAGSAGALRCHVGRTDVPNNADEALETETARPFEAEPMMAPLTFCYVFTGTYHTQNVNMKLYGCSARGRGDSFDYECSVLLSTHPGGAATTFSKKLVYRGQRGVLHCCNDTDMCNVPSHGNDYKNNVGAVCNSQSDWNDRDGFRSGGHAWCRLSNFCSEFYSPARNATESAFRVRKCIGYGSDGFGKTDEKPNGYFGGDICEMMLGNIHYNESRNGVLPGNRCAHVSYYNDHERGRYKQRDGILCCCRGAIDGKTKALGGQKFCNSGTMSPYSWDVKHVYEHERDYQEKMKYCFPPQPFGACRNPRPT